MKRTRHIRRSIVLLAFAAAFAAPTAATAYPVIGDNPSADSSVAEGHAWMAARAKRIAAAQASKPTIKVTKPRPNDCPVHPKTACLLRGK